MSEYLSCTEYFWRAYAINKNNMTCTSTTTNTNTNTTTKSNNEQLFVKLYNDTLGNRNKKNEKELKRSKSCPDLRLM